MDYQVNNL